MAYSEIKSYLLYYMYKSHYAGRIIEYLPWACLGLIITLCVHLVIYLSTSYQHPYIFVHIPKTGGTTLNQWIDTQQKHGACTDIRSAHTHYLDAKTAIQMGYKPITIIREPTDRFLSSFYYWRYGSEDIPEWRRSKTWNKGDQIETPDTLVQIMWNKQHPLHEEVKRTVMQRDEFTHRHHFLPQSLWVNGSIKKTIIICYDSNKLKENIQHSFQKNAIRCQLDDLDKINRSIRPNKSSLSKQSLTHLQQIYKTDYELWQQHCNNMHQ